MKKNLISNFSLFTSPLLAINNPILNNGAVQATNPKGYFNSVLSVIVSIFFLVAVVYFMWHIVFAGYHLIASEGDPKRWESSKNEIVYATVGLFVVFSIFAILKFIGQVLGISGLDVLNLTWPTL